MNDSGLVSSYIPTLRPASLLLFKGGSGLPGLPSPPMGGGAGNGALGGGAGGPSPTTGKPRSSAGSDSRPAFRKVGDNDLLVLGVDGAVATLGYGRLGCGVKASDEREGLSERIGDGPAVAVFGDRLAAMVAGFCGSEERKGAWFVRI